MRLGGGVTSRRAAAHPLDGWLRTTTSNAHTHTHTHTPPPPHRAPARRRACSPDASAELSQIRKDRGYTYVDFITVSADKLPNYEQKLKTFFEEHLHTDEEIRCVPSPARAAGSIESCRVRARPHWRALSCSLTRAAPPLASAQLHPGRHGLL